MTNREKLEQLQGRKISQEEAASFYDSLEIASKEMLYGEWKGSELTAGHPMEGLLGAAGWHGKQFLNEECVHPLVMNQRNGRHYMINPGLVPLTFPFQKLPDWLIGAAVKVLKPLIRTKKYRARLRMIEFRGKVSAAMVYDQIAVIDIFRKVDENTLLGIMDIKNYPSDSMYFFVLEREKADKAIKFVQE